MTSLPSTDSILHAGISWSTTKGCTTRRRFVGAAHGYQFPSEGPLRWDDFSGGDKTVRAKLEELGFSVRVLAEP
jgi:hypothetical protein